MTEIEYKPEFALVVVDVQNDFADPDGSLSVPGAPEVVAAANAEIEEAVAGGATVLYTQDWHPERTPHFAIDGGVWPVHCVGGTWGAAFHPDLVISGTTVRKGTGGEDGYSGFTMRDPETGDELPTPLEGHVRDAGATTVVVVGLATDYCVKATALDAVRLGFDTVVLRDAVAAVDLEPGDGEQALAELTAAGVTVL